LRSTLGLGSNTYSNNWSLSVHNELVFPSCGSLHGPASEEFGLGLLMR